MQEFESTRTVLRTNSGSGNYERLEVMQHAKLIRVISKAAISTQQLGELWPVVDRLGFSARLAAELHDAISARNIEYTENPRGSGKTSRVSLQDFCAIHGYFTAEFWTRWQNDLVFDPLQEICDKAMALGAREVTEPTFQLWTGLLLLLQNKGDVAKCTVLTPLQKNEVNKHVKRVFRRRVKGAGPRLIENLPESPSTLLSEHPGLYAAVFGSLTDIPLQCPFNTALQSVAATVKMRNCGGSGSMAVMSPMQASSTQLAPMQMYPMQGSPMQANPDMTVLLTQLMDMVRRCGNGEGNRSIQDTAFKLPPQPRNVELPLMDQAAEIGKSKTGKKRSIADAAAAVRGVMAKIQDKKDADNEDDEDTDEADEADDLGEATSKGKAAKKRKAAKAKASAAKAKPKAAAKGIGAPKAAAKTEALKKTSFQISVEDSISRVRVRFNDGTSFSKKYNAGSKDKTIAMIKIAAAKMLEKTK